MENSQEPLSINNEIPKNTSEDNLTIDEEDLEFLKELDEENGAGILFTIGITMAILGFIFLLVSLSFLMLQETSHYEDGYQDATVLVSHDKSINVAKVSLVFIAIGALFVFIDVGREEEDLNRIEDNIENNFK